MRPYEERQTQPGQPRSAHPVHGNNEVQAGQDRREADDKYAQAGGDHVGIRVRGGVRSVEGPACIHAAGEDGVADKGGPGHVDVPAQQIQPGEGQILGADHHRDKEVAEDRRNRRDQKQKDHHDAVHGKQLVIGIVQHQVAWRSQQLQADQHGEEAAKEEEQRDRDQIQDCNALVVGGQQPRLDAVVRVQVIRLRFARLDRCFHVWPSTALPLDLPAWLGLLSRPEAPSRRS